MSGHPGNPLLGLYQQQQQRSDEVIIEQPQLLQQNNTNYVSVAQSSFHNHNPSIGAHHIIITDSSNTIPSQQNNINHWSSSLCDCFSDLESCWWGLWCCWILNARTAEAFQVGKSINLVVTFWCVILATLVFQIIQAPFGLIIMIAGFIYMAYNRATMRLQIRQQLGISGDSCEDCYLHACCSCCAVCQEARQAKASQLKTLDFCSGQDLAIISQKYNVALEDSRDNFMVHFNSISMASQIILVLCSIVALSVIFIQIASKNYLNLLILFFVFVQPFVFLYLIYWRSRRKIVSLDNVIKIFAVGFWFTTFQSVVLEIILQFLIALLLAPFINPSEIDPSSTNANHLSTKLLSMTSKKTSMIFDSIFQSYQLNYNEHYQSFDISNVAMNISSGNDTIAGYDDAVLRSNMRHDIFFIILGLFLMAFVVAAGVEETMKHFSVKCCTFPNPLRDPHCILVYLMAGALGFATAENIEYVFAQSSQSSIPGTSIFLNELFVLFIRILMPVHVICSVLQASNYAKVVIGIESMSLFGILLPAILLHGFFDFFLFLFGSLQYIFNDQTGLYDILSLLTSISLTIGGAYWAYRSYKDVQTKYDNGWTVSRTEESVHNGNL